MDLRFKSSVTGEPGSNKTLIAKLVIEMLPSFLVEIYPHTQIP